MSENVSSNRGGACRKGGLGKVVGFLGLIIGVFGLGALTSPAKAEEQSGAQPPIVRQPDSKPVTKENASPKAGDTKILTLPGGVTMEMIYVAPGSFMMGSPTSEDGRDSEETQHHVTLTKGFWLGKYEVTQKQWRSVMGNNPSRFTGDDRPVDNVSWEDCQEFVKKVNAQLNCGARLPTEAEWECACRAGTTGAYAGRSLDAMGWYSDNSGRETHPVGQKQANALGFYDMHGNVWEWCSDWKGDYKDSPSADPQGPASGVIRVLRGACRVLRGGCCYNFARLCRSANRDEDTPGRRSRFYGFRLCCSAQP